MNRIFRVITLVLGLWLLFELASRLIAEILWFDEVGYLQEFLLRLQTQIGLWAIAFLISISFLLGNLVIANRLKHPSGKMWRRWGRGNTESMDERFSASSPGLPTSASSTLKLRLLIPAVVGLSALAGVVLIYYVQTAFDLWFVNIKLPTLSWQLPPLLQFFSQLFRSEEIRLSAVNAGLLVFLTIAILITHQFWLKAIALLISLLLAFLLSARWVTVLQFFQATSFNSTDPLFNRDISFYVFSLPIWELLKFWLLGIFVYSLASVSLIYLRSSNSLSEGWFPGFSVPQRLHLNALTSLLMLAVGLHYWLLRYELLYSKSGFNFGASYTEVNVQLPIYTGLSVLAVAIAVYLLWRIYILSKRQKTRLRPIPFPRQLIYLLALYVALAGLSGEILPTIVQRLVVQPNELAQERPYIARTIALTREAFNLNAIDAETFDPQGQLTAADLKENQQTIRNIRLWDSRPLLQTNRQLQQIRPYYKFPGADIDRYTLLRDIEKQTTEYQQTIIAARELDYGDVPQQAQTWINKHLIYTHGYGFTLSPVNVVGPGGLPYYYVKDIGVEDTGSQGSLQITTEEIRASIPINQPRIYYGEITDTYVMTGTKTQELDYPSGNENVYNVYDGRGGISIGAMWRRLLFAQYLKDWQMLLTRNFTSQTKLLFRRTIRDRVQAIAPFLRFDSDPYLVAASGGGTTLTGQPTDLYWIIDAYTVSDRYPYSDPGKNSFNYIRNSVKIVVDAYNGTVDFYVADPTDPVITTLGKIFPQMLKPLQTMPVALRSHIRYPGDFFRIQSERLLTYHMTDPQVFYNREDLWEIPTEIYGNEQRTVEPYYLIMKLPKAETEEFILLLPFKPNQRANLIAWLAARSDGENYGRLLLYEFPKQLLVYGTQQIEALINQDPVISQQISLWNREGSKAVQGNLLVIPIEQSLLYVEPLYLEAEQNSLPTFVAVIIAYENRIVMAETLEQALAGIFQPEQPAAPTIIRPVE
ncbi:UPF0182 family protein [Fischerella thermalis]|uniref:UPF0182 family protein n=1 Tax=Fischerella thermalis TaxID=372787 RepID=UPI000C8089B0|nr:UPF0182 family protein [Fischerella thermalis]PLZ07960.1 hypothetical protein CBP19_17850 [Fischerella thermalis WC1110]PLZ12048.1 hypothetical protein CBP17_08775 [Fischerella thermalis WC114]PLZ12729.1 hypothetical protein CBP18_05955 [Fischerella thermalis WC119]PLZ23742.1 hypothetical protein CBP30_03250 [Fischerella thermalis WC157]PLZ40066.1 hypothetical protein CBP26_11780 [Fischerella thermalis WC538]